MKVKGMRQARVYGLCGFEEGISQSGQTTGSTGDEAESVDRST